MGEYLSTPNREKKSEEGENGKVTIDINDQLIVIIGQIRNV